MYNTYPLSGSAPQPSASATQYNTLDCTLDGTWIAAGSFDQRESLVTTPFELQGLTISVTTAPGVGNSRTFTVMRSTEGGSPLSTGITVTISDTATSGSSSAVASFGIGDTITLQSAITGTPAAAGTTDWYTTYRARMQQIFSCNFTAQSNAVDSYTDFMGAYSATAEPTESDAQMPCPCAGTISSLYIRTPAGAPGAGTSYQVILRKNGADTALTATISGTGSTANDTANSVTVAAGDLLAWRIIPTGTPATRSIVMACNFEPDTYGQSWWGFSLQGNTSTTLARYIHPYGRGQGTFNATETSTDVKIAAGFQVDAMYVRQGTAPDTGAGTQSYAYQVRRNAANDGPAVTISEASTTGNNGTDGTTTSAGDLLAVSITPSGTPAGSNGIGIGVLFKPVSTAEGFVDVCSAELGTSSAPYYGGAMNFAGSTTPTVATNKVKTGTYSYRVSVATTGTSYFECHGTDMDNHPSNRGHYIDTAYYATQFNYTTKATTASGEEILQVVDPAGTMKAAVRLNADGTLAVYNSANTLTATGATVLAADTWYRIEFKCGTGASGAYELQINGVSEVSGTMNCLTTRNAKALWGKPTNRNGDTVDYNYDDLWVSDTAFQTKHLRVKLVVPNAAGAVQTWTASTDTPKDYTQINEIPPNGSTEIAAKAAGAAFSVALAGQPNGVLKAVKQLGYFADAVSDGDSREFLRLRTSGTDYDNGGFNTSLTEGPLSRVYNTDVSGAAWTGSVFDGAEVGAYHQKTVANAVGCSWMGVLVLYEERSGLLPLLGVG